MTATIRRSSGAGQTVPASAAAINCAYVNRLPMIPDEVIAELRSGFPEDEVLDCDRHVDIGDQVTIGEGPFLGMKARVLRVMTPYQRVEVLLEMLGRVTPVIVNPATLVIENPPFN